MQNNPKNGEPKHRNVFHNINATTIGDANENGTNSQDVSSDFRKGFLGLVDGQGEHKSRYASANEEMRS